MSALVLKVAWNSELRRVSVPKESLNLSFLQQKISGMFSLPDKSFVLKYLDGDDDVTLSSNEDCTKAFNQAMKQQPPILRVVVQERGPEEEEPEVPAPPVEIPCETPQVVSGYLCSVCRSELSQVHYKCLNCLNFELCEQCEETGLHDVHHLLVKLRTPISTYPVKQQLLFTAHIEDEEQKQLAKLHRQCLQEDDKLAKLKAREIKKLEKEAEKFKRMQEKEEIKLQKLAEKEAKRKLKEQIKRSNKQAACELACASPDDSLVWMDIPSTTPLNDSLFNPVQVQEQLVAEAEPVPVPIEETMTTVCQPAEETDISELISEFQDVQPEQQPEAIAPSTPSVDVVLEKETEKEMELVPAPASCPVQQPAEEAPVEDKQQQPNPFKQNLERLAEMGFTDHEKNIKLLVDNRGDLDATVEQLLHARSWFPEFFPFRF